MNNIHRDTEVFRILRNRIIFAEYYPGQVLPISELAEDLGVSATPIREALVCLDNEGLVHRVPNSSARVKEISLQDLRDIFELRLILVEQVGILAAQRIDKGELAKLQDLLGKFVGARESLNVMQVDAQLHDVVYDATKNRALAKVAKTVRNQITRLWFIVKGDEHVFSAMVEDWKQLYKALKDRNGPECATVLREHVLKFIDEVKKSIGSGR
jgi:DNA-binding GntR family transcriptional regulator